MNQDTWKTALLKEVSSLSRKPRSLTIAEYEAIPFIPMALIPDSGFFATQWETREPGKISSGTFFNEGDVLFAKITPCLENGKQGIVRDVPNGWGYATTEVYPIHPEKVTAEFLAAYLKKGDVRKSLASKMQGTTGRQRLPKDALENLEMPLPPLPEQKAIAGALRAVQEAKEATEGVIAAARELKASLMRHLFTYGPVPFDEADRVNLKETEIGPVPEEWNLVEIKDVCEVKGSTSTLKAVTSKKGHGDKHKLLYLKVSDLNVPQNIPRVKTSNIQVKIEANVFDKIKFVPPGSVVLPKRGAAIATNKKRLTNLPCLLDPNLIAVIPNEIYGEYLFRWFETFDLRTITDDAVLPQINKKDIEPLQIPLPPKEIQIEISNQINVVEEKIEIEQRKLSAIIALFDALLHNLMTGQVRVPVGEEVSA